MFLVLSSIGERDICILSRTTVTFVCLTFTFDQKVVTPSTYIQLRSFLYSILARFRMSVDFIARLCFFFTFYFFVGQEASLGGLLLSRFYLWINFSALRLCNISDSCGFLSTEALTSEWENIETSVEEKIGVIETFEQRRISDTLTIRNIIKWDWNRSNPLNFLILQLEMLYLTRWDPTSCITLIRWYPLEPYELSNSFSI